MPPKKKLTLYFVQPKTMSEDAQPYHTGTLGEKRYGKIYTSLLDIRAQIFTIFSTEMHVVAPQKLKGLFYRE